MPENWKWYRIRGLVLERAYIWVTLKIWGPPDHKIDCGCDRKNCIAWAAVDAFERARRGIV